MKEIINHFSHIELSNDQINALNQLDAFLNNTIPIFMLKGYSGSGKTTILKGFVEYLDSIERGFALFAPTGRAAKVIREKTGKEAFTIHKGIYSYEEMVEVDEGESFYYRIPEMFKDLKIYLRRSISQFITINWGIKKVNKLRTLLSEKYSSYRIEWV